MHLTQHAMIHCPRVSSAIHLDLCSHQASCRSSLPIRMRKISSVFYLSIELNTVLIISKKIKLHFINMVLLGGIDNVITCTSTHDHIALVKYCNTTRAVNF